MEPRIWRNRIEYKKVVVEGITTRPDSRCVMRKAIDGHPIEITSGKDYINLYHVFDRLVAEDSTLAAYKLVKKQIGENRWLLFAVTDYAQIPEVPLDEGYDPRRGRFRRYIEQLVAGETITLASKEEANRVRRAWQLFVKGDKQRHLMASSVQPVGDGTYTVTVKFHAPQGNRRTQVRKFKVMPRPTDLSKYGKIVRELFPSKSSQMKRKSRRKLGGR